MGDQIDIISDGNGIAIFGSPDVVEEFLESFDLPATQIPESRLLGYVSRIASIASLVPQIAQGSSKWIQITEESAKKIKDFGLVPTKSDGISHAMIGKAGKIESWIQVIDKPSILMNPSVLAGIGTILAQQSIEKSLDEIKQYLEKIEEKLDTISRAQANSQLARLDGVKDSLRLAMAMRESTGKISDVTWSRLQTAPTTIFEVENFALRQIRDMVLSIDDQEDVSTIRAEMVKARKSIQIWMKVIADCAMLHDEFSLIEIEYVRDESPHEVESHRQGLKLEHERRMKSRFEVLQSIFGHVIIVGESADNQVMMNPFDSPRAIQSCREVTNEVTELCSALQLEALNGAIESRSWAEAVRQATAGTSEAVQHVSKEAAATAKALKGKVSEKLAERQRRRDEP